jgi:hygromycin-B 7''-O-kinase
MSIRPDLQVSVATAQAIVDRVIPGGAVATVSNIHGGEIAAVYEVAFVEALPSLVLKVYPDTLHWKMQKETLVLGSLVQDTLFGAVVRLAR